MKTLNIPFIAVENNTVIGLVKTKRQPMYENEMCKAVGLIATCNACERIIFEDENWQQGYTENHGYCRGCAEEYE